jgi:hypothetical protein
MHRGRVILGAVVGGVLGVAALTQVGSWSPDDSGWDGVDEPARPTVPNEPMPFGQQISPGCEDEYEAALREAERTGSTMMAVLCEPGGPPETDQPTVVWTPPGE